MATIDKLDIAVHMQYARRMEFVEAVQGQYHLEEARTIPAQTLVVDIYPRLSEMDLLLGVSRTYAPWAYFYPPKGFFKQRRHSFARHRMAPALGSLDKAEADGDLVASIETNTPEEEEEKNLLQAALKQIDEINDLIGFVLGRMGQFLQG